MCGIDNERKGDTILADTSLIFRFLFFSFVETFRLNIFEKQTNSPYL